MEHQNDSVGFGGGLLENLQLVEEVVRGGNFRFGLKCLRLHVLQHVKEVNDDYPNLVTLPSCRMKIHQRRDVLRIPTLGPVGGNVNDFMDESPSGGINVACNDGILAYDQRLVFLLRLFDMHFHLNLFRLSHLSLV